MIAEGNGDQPTDILRPDRWVGWVVLAHVLRVLARAS
jgi:hypothetical protein